MSRPTVQFCPAEDGHLVMLKACWSADNGYETAVFATKEEAIGFCVKRWRASKDEIRVVEPAAVLESSNNTETT